MSFEEKAEAAFIRKLAEYMPEVEAYSTLAKSMRPMFFAGYAAAALESFESSKAPAVASAAPTEHTPEDVAIVVDALKERDELMQLKGKRAVLHELLELADCFVLGSEPPYEKAWEVLDAKYAEAPKEIKIGSKWQGYKMNAEVISIVDGGVNYWHTHHDGTRSVYRTTVDFFRHNCVWLEDPHEILPKTVWRSTNDFALEVEVHDVTETLVNYFPTDGGMSRNVLRSEWYGRFTWVSAARTKQEVSADG
jgi:hypothetical protein